MEYSAPTLEKRGDKYFLVFPDGEIERTEEQLRQDQEGFERMKLYLEKGLDYAKQNRWSVADVPKEFDTIIGIDIFIQTLTKSLEQLSKEGDGPEKVDWIISQLISGTYKDLHNPLLKRKESVNKYFLESVKSVQEIFKGLQIGNASKPLPKAMQKTITDFFLILRQEEHVITADDIEGFRPDYPDCKVGDVYSPTVMDTAKCTETDFNLLYENHWKAYGNSFEYATESTFLDKEITKAEKWFTVLSARGDDDYWAKHYLELSKSYRHWLERKLPDKPNTTKRQPIRKGEPNAPAIRLFCGMIAETGIIPQDGRPAMVFCQNVCEKYNLAYTDRVRQHFTAIPSFKSGNKDLQKVIKYILPLLPKQEIVIIEKYITDKMGSTIKK